MLRILDAESKSFISFVLSLQKFDFTHRKHENSQIMFLFYLLSDGCKNLVALKLLMSSLISLIYVESHLWTPILHSKRLRIRKCIKLQGLFCMHPIFHGKLVNGENTTDQIRNSNLGQNFDPKPTVDRLYYWKILSQTKCMSGPNRKIYSQTVRVMTELMRNSNSEQIFVLDKTFTEEINFENFDFLCSRILTSSFKTSKKIKTSESIFL